MDQRTKSNDKWNSNDDRPGRYKKKRGLKFLFQILSFSQRTKR